jgi:organic radical activating enzyme
VIVDEEPIDVHFVVSPENMLVQKDSVTIEELLQENDPLRIELLRNIDVLVDGPFIQAQRDEQLRFRGSANQRILEMKDFLPDE